MSPAVSPSVSPAEFLAVSLAEFLAKSAVDYRGGELSERRAECAPATPTTTAGERCTRRQVETGARRRLSAIPGSRGQPHRACINPKRRR